MNRQARLITGLGVVTVLALSGAFGVYQQAQAVKREPDPYLIGRQTERFRELSSRVPRGAVIGYVTDQPPESTLAQAMYFGAQYALAPRLLVWGVKESPPEWVLGNFSRPVDLAKVAAERGLKLADDLGSGVVLFRKERNR